MWIQTSSFFFFYTILHQISEIGIFHRGRNTFFVVDLFVDWNNAEQKKQQTKQNVRT